MQLKLGWGAKIGVAAGALVLALLFVPVPTSLGNTGENVLTGWQGVYDQYSHVYACRFLFGHDRYNEVVMTAFPQRWLIRPGGGEFAVTRIDPPGLLRLAFLEHPHQVEKNLGTWHNVAAPMVPFPGRPLAYSPRFLHAMAAMGFNPNTVGGPDIPPNLGVSRAVHGEPLQIDTGSDNNRLVQLHPGEMPEPMKMMIRGGRLFQ